MNILTLIKKRKTSRHYKDKPIPKRIIKRIVEAGRWGPSIHGFQPWRFVVINNKESVGAIFSIVEKKLERVSLPGFLFQPTIRVLKNAKALVCIYNNKAFTSFTNRFNKTNIRIAMITEISSIAAGIQNMILVAEDVGIGSCWLDTPLFCQKEISAFLNIECELMGILALGYPAKKAKRFPRRAIDEVVKYID